MLSSRLPDDRVALASLSKHLQAQTNETMYLQSHNTQKTVIKNPRQNWPIEACAQLCCDEREWMELRKIDWIAVVMLLS